MSTRHLSRPGSSPRPSTDRRRRLGFTLIELIVVVIILGVLAAIGAVSYNKFTGDAHTKAVLASARTAADAISARAVQDATSTDAAVAAAWGDGSTGSAAIKTAFSLGYTGTFTYAPGTAGAGGTVDVAEPHGSAHACVLLSRSPDDVATAAGGSCASLTPAPTGGSSTTPTPTPTPTASASTTAPAPAPAAQAVSDTFARADTAAGLGTTSDGTQQWSAPVGTWGISANHAYAAAVSGSRALSVLQIDSGDQTVSATLSSANIAILFRYSDPNNYWTLSGLDASSRYNLTRVSGGVTTGVAQWVGAVGAITVDTYGSTISAFDSTGTLMGTVTSTVNQNATGVGLYSSSASATANAATFSAKDAATSAPTPLTSVTGSASNTAVTLNWTKSPAADFAAYRVFRNGVKLTDITNPATLTYADSTGTPGTVYTYRVAVVDAAGNLSSGDRTQNLGLPKGPVSVTDNFNRAASTTTLGTTSDGTQGWQTVSGTFGINASHQGYAVSLTSGRALSLLDVGSANQTVYGAVTNAASRFTNYSGLVFRASDASNFWYWNSQLGYGGLYKVVNGVQTQVAGSGASMPLSGGQSADWTVVTSGNTITIKRPSTGTTVYTYNDASGFNNTATKVGILSLRADANDDFWTSFTATGS